MKKIIYFLLILSFAVLPAKAAIDGALAMEATKAQQEGNLEKQHVIAQKIMVTNPEDPFGYSLEADYFFKNEQYEKALTYYSKAINAVKTVKEHDSVRLRKMGLNEEQIEQTLNFDGSLAKYYKQRGICLDETGKPIEALKDYDNSEKLIKHKTYELSMLKSFCFCELGQYEEALKNLYTARQLTNNQENLKMIEEVIQSVKKRQQVQ